MKKVTPKNELMQKNVLNRFNPRFRSTFVILATGTCLALGAVAQQPTQQVLPEEYRRAIVTISGKKGDGTGFFATIRGKTFVVTNLHVLEGNLPCVIETLDGGTVVWDEIFGAVAHDLAIISVSGTFAVPATLRVSQDVVIDCELGTQLLIVGNSKGHGALLESVGEVVGLGPRVVEHSCATFGGNSGSPMIETKTWKVLALHTLAIRGDYSNWAEKDAFIKRSSPIKSEVRRFGYRLDSVQQWQKIDPTKWMEQSQLLEDMATDLESVSGTVSRNKEAWVKSPRIGPRMDSLAESLRSDKLSAAAKDAARESTFFFVRSIVQRIHDQAIEFQKSGYEFYRSEFQKREMDSGTWLKELDVKRGTFGR